MTDGERPRGATIGIAVMAAAGAAATLLGLYFVFWGDNAFGGFLVSALGGIYMLGARALHRGESWGWGAGVFAGAALVLFNLFLLPLGAAVVLLIAATLVLLFRVRAYYGMVRYHPEDDERRKKELEAQRTANPDGYTCPNCGSTRLWVAPDGSAYCTECKRGIIALKTM
ncbi:MAG: hypothetical protein HY557_06170 [Euryarchaeota archaeon]|nr:hypothetical protein [Euryarchaeota archaeon]